MNPIKLIVPATLTPVTLDEAKAQLKVTTSDEDALITSKLAAAVKRVEDYRQSNVMDAQYELYARQWPSCSLSLQKNPVSVINSVKYYDEDGNLQPVSSSLYRLQDFRVPGRLEFDSAFTMPELHDREYPIIVNFQAGYLGASSVLPTIKEAILLELGSMHEIRQSETVGNGLTVVQMKNASMSMIDAETLWL